MNRIGQHNIENVNRTKRALLAAAILGAVICGFLVVSTVQGLRSVREAKMSLKREKAELSEISLQMGKVHFVQPMKSSLRGSLDSFAVKFSAWARARGVTVTALVPEGTPTTTDVEAGGAKLGTWMASRARIKGIAPLSNVMSVLNEFRTAPMPIELESYAVESADAGAGEVSFDIMITVYEKQSGAG